jgi:hypothetical protein
MARRRRSREELNAVDALLERLHDFIRLNYLTAAEVARQIGVRDATIYDWLLGRTRPTEPQRITAFLDSFPREEGIRRRAKRIRVPRIQELARDPEATPLPVL